ncbi:MAG TPA: hypothetical protein VK582_00935 [Pyrinomonadaceae bacterium]|nr:hypothetical protein [Pyrinomonadaceae bacterium]
MASIPALRWASQSFNSPNIESLNDMFGAAAAAMTAVGLTKVKHNANDVSGLSANTIAAVASFRCGKTFILMVMVAGSNGAETKVILDKLLHEIPKHIPNL